MTPGMDGDAGYPNKLDSKLPPTSPSISPIIPPIRHIIMASIKNCILIEEFLAPNALRVPISRVLSVTDTSIIFITPIPPTRSAIPAIMDTARVSLSIRDVSESNIPSNVIAFTSNPALPA